MSRSISHVPEPNALKRRKLSELFGSTDAMAFELLLRTGGDDQIRYPRRQENLGGGSLLRQRLAEVVGALARVIGAVAKPIEQARVLDGNNRLVCEKW